MSWLGDMLGGAVGETVAKVGDTVKKFVTTDADRMALENELTKITLEAKIKADEIALKYQEMAVANAKDINQTMQSESASEHWPTYAWRPFIGFVFGLYIASMFILPLFGLAPVPLSADLVLTIGAILGIASWFRGKMQADPNIPTVNRG